MSRSIHSPLLLVLLVLCQVVAAPVWAAQGSFEPPREATACCCVAEVVPEVLIGESSSCCSPADMTLLMR